MADFNNKTVYVLDSYGLIFRCYFAFINRPLTNSKGQNISALFGFFRNLHYILQHYKPDYIFAAMDSKSKTFRHDFYPEYKATRNKTPDDLHAQIPWICQILQEMGIPILQCDGYEADDIIATIAKKCKEKNQCCRILSGDKDLMQLVDDTTQILKPESGSTWKVTGKEGVFAEWGVNPEQLLDLLSLYGDTADNIPGVKGIGVKTAGKLLTDYQNLDGIYQHIEEIKGSVKTKLQDGKENAYFSQKLIRLEENVPCPDIDLALEKQAYKFDYKKAADLLKQYEAFAVAKSYSELAIGGESLPLAPADASATPSSGETPQGPQNEALPQAIPLEKNKGDYKAFTKINELKEYIDQILESPEAIIAYDSETTGLDTINSKIIGFSLSTKAHSGVYIPLASSEENLFESERITKEEAFSQLQRLFQEEKITIVFHNAKFDLKILSSNGFKLPGGKNKCSIQDTMISAWLLNPEHIGKKGYSLEYLAESKLNLLGIEYDDIVEKGKTFESLALEDATAYAAEDADFTLQLWQKFSTDLKNNNLYDLYQNIEMKLLPILAKMELNGIYLDSQFLIEYSKELSQGIAKKEAEIYKEVGHEFNIASPKQLQTVLFEERNLKPGKKTKTGYSTDTSVLEELSLIDCVPKLILEYRELTKLQSTYVESLPKLTDKDGKIHTDFIQTGTATGRLSCREPNLQNIPIRNEAGRKIRSAFTAPKGKVLISADYAQIELVILAHLSADKNMCQAFMQGTDVHKATAALIYGIDAEKVTAQMRRIAKTINFGVIYGMSAFRLAQDLGISRREASGFIESYFQTYADVKNFINTTIMQAEEKGYVETIFARKRPILAINSKNKVEKAAAERIAVNTPVQGSAADIVKKAMIDVSEGLKKLNNGTRLLLQVHDELIFECEDNPKCIEESINLIRDKMENAVKLSIPLRVSIEYGKSWGDFH